MNEKILIQSNPINLTKRIILKLLGISYGAIYLVTLIYCIMVSIHDRIDFEIFDIVIIPLQIALVAAIYLIPVLVIIAFVYYISKNQIIVTDKRISGKKAFGKKVDLPIDSVSSVGKINLFKRVSISTSSGNVGFWGLNNYNDIYNVISDLIINRQSSTTNNNFNTTTSVNIDNDYTEELKKLKELLDSGILTQEEFESKKKQLLNL